MTRFSARYAPLVLCLVLLAASPGVLLAQDSVEEAQALRDEGVTLFKKGKYAEALDRYLGAIEMYREALGDKSPVYLEHAAVLGRAVIWCRVEAGPLDRLKADYRRFFTVVADQGGNAKEERSVRDSVSYVLDKLVRKKAWRTLASVVEDYTSNLARTMARPGLNGDLKKRLAIDRVVAWQWEMTKHFVSGDGDVARKKYARVQAAWKETGLLHNLGWAPGNAFYAVTKSGDFAHAPFLFLEALKNVKEHDLPGVLRILDANFVNFLKRLEGEGQAGEAIAFLGAVLEDGGKAFVPGLDEARLRRCLDRFLWKAEKYGDALENGEAWHKIAKKSGGFEEACAALCAARAACRAKKYRTADKMVAACLKQAEKTRDPIRRGYGLAWKARVLTGLRRFKKADSTVREAMALFESIDDRQGVAEAKAAGLENGRAKKDKSLIDRYYERSAVASGGAGGGAGAAGAPGMSSRQMWDRWTAEKKDVPVIEVRRQGETIVFKNLYDGSTVERALEQRFRYVNAWGFLFELKGAEIALRDASDRGGAPGMPGQSVFVRDGVSVISGPDFSPFKPRGFVPARGALRVTAGMQLLAAK